MKITVHNASLRLLLKWAQGMLFTGAVLMLGYCTFVLVDAGLFQRREALNFEHLLAHRGLIAQIGSVPSALSTSAPAIGPDGLIGRIEIPRVGISVVVIEGTGQRTLRRAAGHVAGTALPGEVGNVGISAHRDTFFRPLRNIQRDDLITLTTLRGDFHYRVVSTNIVDPGYVAVLNPDGNQILTLVTCYPFYFVGAAPSRFIVRAERVL